MRYLSLKQGYDTTRVRTRDIHNLTTDFDCQNTRRKRAFTEEVDEETPRKRNC